LALFPRFGEEAERLYIREEKSPGEIAVMLPVSEKTISSWVKKNQWNAKRVLNRRSALSRLEKLEKILDGKIDELERLDPSQIDGGLLSELVKAIDAANKMRRQYRPGELMVYAGEFFIPWLKVNCPDADLRPRIEDYFRKAGDEALRLEE